MACDVKICGLNRPEDIDAAITHGAAFLGFIVEAESPRKLTTSQTAKLVKPVKNLASIVAVTVNADHATIDKIVRDMQPDFIQFHGDETPEYVAGIARTHGVGTIKAIKVRRPEDLSNAEAFYGIADIILFDASPPIGSDVQGGHGTTFDWTILANADLPDRWALAGGLTPNNARQALSLTNAPILDVSSGVESRPGIKDASKIRALMDAVKYGHAG